MSLRKTVVSRVHVLKNNTPNADCNSALFSTHNHLPRSIEAPFDSYAKQYEPTFLENTCVDFLLEKEAHRTLVANCIRLMSDSLQQDICGVGAPGTLVSDIENSRVEQCLPPELQYACLYWVQHLQYSGDQLHDDDQIHHFLQTNLLHWLEALSWMRKTAEGVRAIVALESITLVSLFLARH